MKKRFSKALLLTTALYLLAGCGAANDPVPFPEPVYWPPVTAYRPDPSPNSPSPQDPDPTQTNNHENVAQPTPTPMPSPTPRPPANNTSTFVPPITANPFPTTFLSPYNAYGQLSRERASWGFVRNTEHQPPPAPGGRWGFDIRPFNAVHIGDISGQYVYLTFDLGYEYRFTPVILDTLKDKGITAAFFITGSYLIHNPELVQRMVAEGHIVANHGRHHHSNYRLTEEQLIFEINEVCRLFTELTGKNMPRFYRPPYGEYSAFSLYITNQLGWKTVFWSIAFVDWITTAQPGQDYVINHFQQNIHNGAIPLLHTVSQSNAEALPYVIDWLHDSGFTFKSLYDLP